MKVALCALLLVLTTSLIATAQPPTDRPKTREEAEKLLSTLKFEQGTVPLGKDLATITLPPDLRFLNGHDAGIIITKLWGNPPHDDPLGMLVPAGDMLKAGWGVIITYEKDGYVKDNDAASINYDDLLKQIQKSISDANPERKKQGYPTFQLVGWAAPPRYDHETHKLYWAKNLKFDAEDENTLNYNIRMLGRRGVLVLNAVATMDQLPEIEQNTPKILAAVDFNPGNRYTDFDAGKGDKVATYGIAALIAGGIAAKAGLFKTLWLALLAGKKFIIIAVVAIGAWFRKLFGKKDPVG